MAERGFKVVVGGGIGLLASRPSRRAGPSWIAPPRGRYGRPANAKLVTIDRSKAGRGSANAIANEVRYAGKEGPIFERDERTGEIREADPVQKAEEWKNDRFLHHVIVSPNDGAKLTDPNRFAQRVLENWEKHAGKLEAVWSVEEKPDRAHPEGNRHFHFLVRGVQDGKDLEFTAAMVRRGFRDGAREAATAELGAMSVREREQYERQLERMKWEREREKNRDRGEERTL